MLLLRALRLALMVLFVGAIAGAAAAEPAVWVVKSPTATIVLFGSVHLLPPELKSEPPKLVRALAAANEVWFEIPIDEADNLAAGQAALAAGLQPAGGSLSALLTRA